MAVRRPWRPPGGPFDKVPATAHHSGRNQAIPSLGVRKLHEHQTGGPGLPRSLHGSQEPCNGTELRKRKEKGKEAMMNDWRARLKGLYEEFMKFPKRLRIGIGIGGAVFVLAVLVMPGEALIAAVTAFGAAFSGVFLSFRMERRRQEAEEKSQFARCITAIKIENGVNEGLLRGVVKDARPGHAPTSEMQTEALQTALSNIQFYRWAEQSLVLTATVVRTELSNFNNLLAMHREAIVAGHTLTEKIAEKLRVRAEANRERLRVMEKPLNDMLKKFPAPRVADRPYRDVRESLRGIAQWQNEKLAGIGADKSMEDGDGDGHRSPATAETG